MLAHVEQVQHVHPHPAGTPWEAIIVGVVLAALLVGTWVLMRSSAGSVTEE